MYGMQCDSVWDVMREMQHVMCGMSNVRHEQRVACAHKP